MDMSEDYLKRRAEQEAVKSLCRSLIVRALRDYVTYKRTNKSGEHKLFSEASEWIFNGYQIEPLPHTDPIVIKGSLSQDEARKELLELDRLMSFESVCAILGWDANLVRKRVKVLTQADLDRIGPSLMDL